MDMRTAQQWLANKLHGNDGEQVTYTHGNYSVTLQAIPGRQMLRLNEEAGGGVHVTERDYHVRPADLILNGEVVLPQIGGRFRHVENGVANRYEVLPPPGEQVYRADPYATMLRIHTKFVGPD